MAKETGCKEAAEGTSSWAQLVDALNELVKTIGAGVIWTAGIFGRRAIAAAARHRCALANASALEAYASDVWKRICDNAYNEAAGAPPDAVRTYYFEMESLPELQATGVAARDRVLEAAWRELQREIGAAHEHVNADFDSDFGGAEEALKTFEARAWQVAGRALVLADRYREAFRIARRQLAQRDRRIDRQIRDEACARGPAPAVHQLAAKSQRLAARWRLSAFARRQWFAAHRRALARALAPSRGRRYGSWPTTRTGR